MINPYIPYTLVYNPNIYNYCIHDFVASFWRLDSETVRHGCFAFIFCQILCVKFGTEKLQYWSLSCNPPQHHNEILCYLKSPSNRTDILTTSWDIKEMPDLKLFKEIIIWETLHFIECIYFVVKYSLLEAWLRSRKVKMYTLISI